MTTDTEHLEVAESNEVAEPEAEQPQYVADRTTNIVALLAYLRRGETRKNACRLAGIPRRTFYNWLIAGEDFRRRVEDAETEPVREMEALAIECARLAPTNPRYLRALEFDLRARAGWDDRHPAASRCVPDDDGYRRNHDVLDEMPDEEFHEIRSIEADLEDLDYEAPLTAEPDVYAGDEMNLEALEDAIHERLTEPETGEDSGGPEPEPVAPLVEIAAPDDYLDVPVERMTLDHYRALRDDIRKHFGVSCDLARLQGDGDSSVVSLEDSETAEWHTRVPSSAAEPSNRPQKRGYHDGTDETSPDVCHPLQTV